MTDTAAPKPEPAALPSRRFTSLSAREGWRTTRAWLRRYVRWVSRLMKKRRDRFLLLKPALFAHQILYDRTTRSTHRLQIRDGIDFEVVEQIFIRLDYDFAKLHRAREIEAFRERLKESGRRPLIIDAGANCGMATKYFALTYPEAHIVAIEPDAGNLALARHNNTASDAMFLQAAVGSTDGRARLVDPGMGHWGLRVEADPDGGVPIVGVNGIVEAAIGAGMSPFIVKIDIEGFESELFSHNTEWIDQFPVLIIELHDWMLPGSGSARSFLREIAARDRDFVYHGENVFSLSNHLMRG